MTNILNIQGLRAIAVLLVVFSHLTAVEIKYGGSKTILPNFLNFGMFGVDLFFVISGFVMVMITREKFLDVKKALYFLYHRASRIYPTYWIYSLTVLTIFIANPSMVNSSQGSDINVLASLLLIPNDKIPLLMVAWTLMHEMYFYVVFFIFLLFIPEKKLIYGLVLWTFLIVIVDILFKSTNPIIMVIFHPLTIEFVFGCLIALYFFNKKVNIPKNSVLLCMTLICFIIAIFGHSLYHRITGLVDPLEWWRILIYGIPAFFIVTCMVYAEKNGYTVHRLLIKIGDASYSIYLSHVLTLSLGGRIWSLFSSNSTFDNIIMVPILTILAILVGILSHRFIEKPLLTITRKIA